MEIPGEDRIEEGGEGDEAALCRGPSAVSYLLGKQGRPKGMKKGLEGDESH